MARCNFADVVLESGGYLAEFSSARGGTCYRLYHKETRREILRTPESEEALRDNAFLYGNPVLFPPNRICGGSFTFGGKEYRFPVNEPDTGCHLHGKLYQKHFDVLQRTDTCTTFRYQAQAGEYLGFPHAFSVTRQYTLDGSGLTELFTMKNCSKEDMPFMLAFHTTFLARGCLLQQAVGREQLRDGHFLPTGEYAQGRPRDREIGAGTFAVGSEHLSALYEARGDTAVLSDPERRERVCYRASAEYGYRMLFSPANSDYICIEPQTCAIDCFHLPTPPEQNGLIVLRPDEQKTLRTKIWLER